MPALAAAGLALAPDGAAARVRNGRIVYTDGQELFTVRPDGNGRHQLTGRGSSTPTYAGDPEYSPRGRAIAATVPGHGHEELALFSSSGRLRTRVPLDIDATDPTWSRSGKTLAFASCEQTVFTDIEECAAYGVYRVRPDGSKLRRLADGLAPSWSANGRLIAFLHTVNPDSALGERCYELAVMHPDGSDLRAVLPPAEGGRCRPAGSPDFSPNGRRLVFGLSPNIRTVRVNGTDLRLLAKAPHGGGTWGPKYSPDGRYVAYAQSGGGATSGLFVTRAARRAPRRVSKTVPTSLDWRPLPTR